MFWLRTKKTIFDHAHPSEGLWIPSLSRGLRYLFHLGSCYLNSGDNNQAAPASSPTGLGPLSTTQPGFNWPGFSWSVPQNYYYNRPNPTLTNPTSTVSTYSYPGKVVLSTICNSKSAGPAELKQNLSLK